MITEQLIEDLDLPDYDKWVEHIWCDDYWWDYILDDAVSDWSNKGIDIETFGKHNTPQITFDIWGRHCASDGRVRYNGLFYEEYKDRLLSVSPVLAQMFLEDWINVTWGTRRDWLEVSVDFNTMIPADDVFQGGLFAGTSVDEMWEIEQGNAEEFEECITEIIRDLHDDLRHSLEKAYEYDTSEERYKEWILEQIDDALPRHTAS